MPRYNVQHPQTKEWRCFSSIVDNWVTDWMPEDEYEAWRRNEYGCHCGSVHEANQMTLEEAEEIIQMMIREDEEDPNCGADMRGEKHEDY